MNDYDRAEIKAAIVKAWKVWNYTQLPRSAFFGALAKYGIVSRPTEVDGIMRAFRRFPDLPTADDNHTKACGNCNKRFPKTVEHWHVNGSGLQSICKACRSEARKQRWRKKRR